MDNNATMYVYADHIFIGYSDSAGAQLAYTFEEFAEESERIIIDGDDYETGQSWSYNGAPSGGCKAYTGWQGIASAIDDAQRTRADMPVELRRSLGLVSSKEA